MLAAHFACNQAQHTEEVFDVVPADDKATKVMLEGESTGGAGRAFGTDEYRLLECLRVCNILHSTGIQLWPELQLPHPQFDFSGEHGNRI